MKEMYDIKTSREVENGRKFVCFRHTTHLIGKIEYDSVTNLVNTVVDGGYSLYDRAWHDLLTSGIETDHLPAGLKEAVEITAQEYRDNVHWKKLTFRFMEGVSTTSPWALVHY